MCPKCRGSLYTVDRQGVRLEQCENCRGIFLDHGELEQILQAEQRYYGGTPGYAAPQRGYRDRPDSPRPHDRYPDSPRPYRGEGRGHYRDSPRPYGHHGRRRESFLGDLFG